MFRSSVVAALAVTIGLLSAPALAVPAPGTCSPQPDRGAVAVKTPTTTLQLRVAADPDSRTYGLMCVLSLPARTGMIFVFTGTDEDHDFWMKDTLIPLDMVWVSARGIVTTVAANVPATTVDTPEAKIPHRNGRGTYVIELAAGEAAHAGIKTGVLLDVSAVGKAKN
jgi:uncharacterized protein